MSIRLDSSQLVADGILLSKYVGLGILAENIPSTGTDGAGYLYNDVTLPADNGKEIRGEVLTFPASGTLIINEDSSFTFSSVSDGNYSFTYQLYVDGIAIGSPALVSLSIGNVSSIEVFMSQVTDSLNPIDSLLLTKTVNLKMTYTLIVPIPLFTKVNQNINRVGLNVGLLL